MSLKVFLIAIIFVPFTVLGQSHTETCDDVTPLPTVDKGIKDLHEHLSRHGASDEQVMKAFCKTLRPPTYQEITKFIKAKTSGTPTSKEIYGVQFENESSDLIDAFESLTTAMNGLNIIKMPNNQVNIQEVHQVNPECKKVICAVEKIWGQELGLKILYIYKKYGFNSSEYAFSHSKRFEMEEIDDVLMALADVPAVHQPLGRKNQRLNHFSFPNSPDSMKTIANAGIWLYDLWTTQTRPKRQYAVYHELIHNVSFKLNISHDSEEWLALSGWKGKGDDWTYAEDACFSSQYGATNPAEDWAEAASTYRYNPQEFKSRCPKKYAFLKSKVYQGKEYTSANACK